jgi:predicted RNase H-like HicB family nuclease
MSGFRKRGSVLTDYINAAMAHAGYDTLTSGEWYAEIPGLDGLWATGPTTDACRVELRSALEDWILFGLLNGYPVPPVDGIDLLAAKKNVA